ncbi:signal peptidase I [Treponema pectinovorum]|uniref:signal peptidase I n=1 Tax=Treponema pectinovorum TaxID=164 RepID=UPI001C071CD8|nr:signal peptidase I [Treponema pectinovorum]
MRRKLYRNIFVSLVSFFSCFIAVNLIIAFLFYPVKSQSDSMLPELSEKSVVLIAPFLKKPSRGQIMLVKSNLDEEYTPFQKIVDFTVRFFTAGRISPFSDKNGIKPYLRRVVGIPGDTIYIKDYLVYVKPLAQNQFLTEFELTKVKYNLTFPNTTLGIDKSLGAVGNTEVLTLNEGEYFLLGDNRLEALDCRIWGKMKADSFEGRALFVYFPFDKLRFF